MSKINQRVRTKIFLLVVTTLALVWAGGVLGLLAGFFLADQNNPWVRSNTLRPLTNMATFRPTKVAISAPQFVVAAPENGVDYESAMLMNIYTKVNPSVVNVTALGLGSELVPNSFHEFQKDELIPFGGGSGFVWDDAGHIVTNYHVVEESDQVQVTFSDGTSAIAEVVGADIDSDLAVLRIDVEGYLLHPIERGKLEDVKVGMRVAAIGNPFGFEGTLTSGIVSALGRSIPALNNFSIPDSIQTDAAINPGNSGGPLLNEQGEVIGVNAQIHSEARANSGVGFAIPISIVERVVPALIANGVYRHSYMGVSGITLSPLCASDLNLSKDLRGAYITQVFPGTPAAKAGLRAGRQASSTKYIEICPENSGGDLILAINEQTVTTFDEILVYLERYTAPNDTVTLTLLRNGNSYAVDVTLGTRPERMRP